MNEAGPPAADPVRVMLVDDSAVIRRVVSLVLSEEPDVEIVGSAANGSEALDLIDACRPHVVILDVEMPVLDGLETLRALRPRWPGLPVIMFSTLTSRAASATLDALAIGASDYATKPTAQGGLEPAMAEVRAQLLPLIRSWGPIGRRRNVTAARGASAARPAVATLPAVGTLPAPIAPPIRPAVPVTVDISGPVAPPRPPVGAGTARAATETSRRRQPVEAVVIGSSAGGPNALAALIPQFPASMPVPVLLTQHMPDTFTQLLASRLDSKSSVTVVEGQPGMAVEPGHVYIAKGGFHMVLTRSGGRIVIDFDDGPPENYCRPAVDVMFRSAAGVWGGGLLAIVLTGMGHDGVEGARRIVEAGGTVITQDEESCLVWGMPKAVVQAGLSSESLPLDQVAGYVERRLGAGVGIA